MVCDSSGGYPTDLGEDVSLKSSLEELLKCMLRVWCREGQALTRLGAPVPESDKTVIVKREAGGEFGFRIHGSKPVVVSAIEPDTPAESSGLEVGDIIMSVNGRSVMDATHSEVVRLAHSGPDVLELEVARTCNVLAPRVPKSPKESAEVAVYSGYLWRRATTFNAAGIATDKWVRRWFALRRDNCLYYYKTDTDSQPVGAVMLLKYDVEATQEIRNHSFAIRKTGAPSHHLAADNDETMQNWMTVIREAVERNNQADTWLDASVRMQQLPACSIQRPDCFGYLSKQQDRAKKTSSPTGWSRRYCVLKDAALYFYDDANAEKAFGVACLHGFRVHGSAPSGGGRKHAFELQPSDPTQRSYTFATETEMDKKRWLAALEYSIDRWIKVG
ncbi:gamma-2-syntrophin isoform X2 [Microplitis mediator]|uniref:gamma-2-syntrophin isoform X2 n=1 Tax=Microplitis mediator TaxID=375433 RepID=UPI002552EB3C|nr:gamma-2-syntrophin isoform X2 [Microplitis mediator]